MLISNVVKLDTYDHSVKNKTNTYETSMNIEIHQKP